MNIVTVVGARPQFVKAAVVSPWLVEFGVDEQILHTGQHYDTMMSEAFFTELGIPAASWSLGVGSGSHAHQTAAILTGVEQVLIDTAPDLVLIYGDTNSTIAGALAAAKLHVPVAHVEAGLRSFNRQMPEEINRIVADRLSEILFAPTTEAQRQLLSEGTDPDQVHLVGDVMYDLAVRYGARHLPHDLYHRLGVEADGYVLATIHRAENTDDPSRFEAIIAGLIEVSKTLPVVWPAHPRTAGLLADVELSEGLKIIEPIGYTDMVDLERGCAVVATDSGGVQKEAFFHARPCVTLRDETEWVELIELGWNRLVPPTDAGAIAAAILGARGSTGRDARPYGDGDAGRRIAEIVAEAA